MRKIKFFSFLFALVLFSGIIFASVVPELDDMQIKYKTNNGKWAIADGSLDEGFNVYYDVNSKNMKINVEYTSEDFYLSNLDHPFKNVDTDEVVFNFTRNLKDVHVFAKEPVYTESGFWKVKNVVFKNLEEETLTFNGQVKGESLDIIINFNELKEEEEAPVVEEHKGHGVSLTRRGIAKFGEQNFFKFIDLVKDNKETLHHSQVWNYKDGRQVIVGLELVEDTGKKQTYRQLFKLDVTNKE